MDPSLLSWVALGNVLSATLTGPMLAARLGPAARVWASGAGWLVLVLTQVGIVLLGVAAALDGLKVAPVLMIVISALNFHAWWVAVAGLRREAWAKIVRSLKRRSAATA